MSELIDGAGATRPGFVKRVVLPALRIVVAGFTVFVIVRLIRDVDFAQVWSAVKTLTWVEVTILLLLLLAVRVLSAVPMSRFVPGLSVPRSLLNDLGANLVSTVAPPPSDMLLRYSQFKVWGIDKMAGVVGVTLNTMMFYVVKCSGPVLGLLILLATREVAGGLLWTTGLCALVAVCLGATLAAALHAETLAAQIGRAGGRAASRFKADTVDPEAWADKMVEFRALVGGRLRTSWPVAALASMGMLVADASLLVYALRSVSVPAAAIGGFVVVGGFLVAYPLTAAPLAGIGVFDAFLYAFLIDRAGESYDTAVVAALVIWRTTTLLVPYLVAGVALVVWRRAHPALRSAESPGPDSVDADASVHPDRGETEAHQ